MKLLFIVVALICVNALQILFVSSAYTRYSIWTVFRYSFIYKGLLQNKKWLLPLVQLGMLLGLLLGPLLNILYVIVTQLRFSTGITAQLKFVNKHPLMGPEIRGLSYHIPYAIRNNTSSIVLLPELQNKMYWYDYFREHDIMTPEVVGLIRNGRVSLSAPLENDRRYICKHIQDTGGSDVQLLDLDDPPINGSYIIQEYVSSINKVAENWRITTLFDHVNNNTQVFDVLHTINPNPNDIKTNCNSLYLNYEITGQRKRRVQTQHYQSFVDPNGYLALAINQALSLHKSMDFDLLAIGWDVILSDGGPVFLEGNIVPGLLRRYDRLYYSKIGRYMEVLLHNSSHGNPKRG